MGVYSSNRSNLGPVEVVAAEGYHNGIGAAQIMIEACQNDQAFFEAVIGNDFREAAGVLEGTILESELLTINEASFGGVIDKIKEFLVKLLEKIKGLFNAFRVKVANVFVRDNKAFVEKYKAEVLKKDLSKMKYKYSKPTGKTPSDPAIKFSMDLGDMASMKTAEDVQKYINDTFGEDKAIEAALGSTIGQSSTSVGEYAKAVHEYVYEDEDEVEGVSAAFISEIISNLTTAKDALSKIDKDYKKAEKEISDGIKKIEKSRSDLVKLIPKDNSGSVDVGGEKASFSNKDDRDALNAKLNALYKGATTYQTIFTKCAAVDLAETKFGLAQQRRIFAQAAAYTPVKEDAVLAEAVADASNYEVDSCFDSYEF